MRPFGLAVVMVVALLVVTALPVSATTTTVGSAGEGPRPLTPVLSARRFPTALLGAADTDVTASVDSYLAKVVGSTCAIVEVDGRTIVSRNTDGQFVPASTLKLGTALAALDVLGRDATLTTRFVADGPIRDGVLEGDLWVVGGGDPILTTKGYLSVFEDPDQLSVDLSEVADAIAATGIERISGSIIGDDSRYDDVRWVASWPERYQVGGTVSPLSALVVNDGNTGYTDTPDAPTTQRRAGDPPMLFAQTLRTVLSAQGITVDGGASAGRAPEGAEEIGEYRSRPVRDLVNEMLRNSDNTTAELLTKEMGLAASGQGTTAAGVAAIRDSLRRQGVDVDSLVINDGSGLDTGNRATCPVILDLMERVVADPDVAGSFPLGGRSGTLRKRMLATPSSGRVEAKTGTLNGVNALTGSVDSTQGTTLTFVLLHAGNDIRTTGVADGFTDRLVGYASKGPRLSALVPAPVA